MVLSLYRPVRSISRLTISPIVETITREELSRQGFSTIPDWVRTLTQNQETAAYEGTSYLREAPTNIALHPPTSRRVISAVGLIPIGVRARGIDPKSSFDDFAAPLVERIGLPL